MLERAQNKILHTILGVATHTATCGILTLLGMLSIKSIIMYKHLTFLLSLIHLTSDATPRGVLLSRMVNPNYFFTVQVETLNSRNLPSIDELVCDPPSKLAWKSHLKSLLLLERENVINSNMSTLADLSALASNAKLGRPLPVLSFCKGNLALARKSNFRIRLILRCSELNVHTCNCFCT